MNLIPALLVAAALAGQDPAEEAPAQDVDVPAGRSGTFPGRIPEGASKAKPVPLLVACHGHGDNAKNFLACLRSTADAAGVAILAPQGTEKVSDSGFGWNDFPDRAKVIEGAIRAMLKAHPIDPKRIVWLGHSAGTWVCCADGPALGDLCAGMILTAAPTATLEGGARTAKPKVCLFLGTEDGNFANWGAHLAALKGAKVGFTANKITDLGHELPDREYIGGAIAWILAAKGTEREENTLPEKPPSPEDRGLRHLLIRWKGAVGAGADVKRSEKDAEKEAEKQAALLKKEKADKRLERVEKVSEAEGAKEDKGALTAEALEAAGGMLRWACWTLAKGEVRVLKSPAGVHAVWAEK